MSASCSAIGLGGVLAAEIRVTDVAGNRSLSLGSHHPDSRRRFGPHIIAHGPTDNLAGGEIEHGSQVELALTVGRSVISASQTMLGIAAENGCLRRLGAIGRS